MAAVYETAYPRLKADPLQRDIKRLFTPTPTEGKWINNRRIDKTVILGNVVLLKCFQRLGYFPKLNVIPMSIIDHVAKCLSIEPPTKQKLLFSSSQSIKRAKNAIRAYRKVKKIETPKQNEWLVEFSLKMATTKDNIIDIINAMIEIILKERYEIPGFTTLERIASSSRATVNKEIVKRISVALSDTAKKRLQSLLEEKDDDGESLWLKLKQEPKRPTSKTLKQFLLHAVDINKLQQVIGILPEIPEEKRLQLVNEANAYDIHQMKSIAHYKRYSLLALLVNTQFYFTTDCIVDMFNREIHKLHNRGKQDLKQFQEGAVKESESLIVMLKDVANIMIDETTQSKIVLQINSTFDHDSKSIVKRCDHIVLQGLENHLPFLERRYTGYLRTVLLDCLELLEIEHTTHDNDLLSCLAHILKHRKSKLKEIPVKSIKFDRKNKDKTVVDWISDKWSKLLFKVNKPRIINRHLSRSYFEMAVLSEMARRFKSGDLFVLNSAKFDDYREHVIPQKVGATCKR